MMIRKKTGSRPPLSPINLPAAAAAAIMLAALLLVGCGAGPEMAASGETSRRPQATDFRLKDLQGREHRLSDYRGKVVVLNFWDTWCPPCRQEIPDFIDAQEKRGADGLQLLGIALGQEGTGKVKEYASRTGINYPILLLGGSGDLLASYGGIRSIPATFIIDRNGRIAAEHIGYLSRKAFDAMVTPVLGEGEDPS